MISALLTGNFRLRFIKQIGNEYTDKHNCTSKLFNILDFHFILFFVCYLKIY